MHISSELEWGGFCGIVLIESTAILTEYICNLTSICIKHIYWRWQKRFEMKTEMYVSVFISIGVCKGTGKMNRWKVFVCRLYCSVSLVLLYKKNGPHYPVLPKLDWYFILDGSFQHNLLKIMMQKQYRYFYTLQESQNIPFSCLISVWSFCFSQALFTLTHWGRRVLDHDVVANRCQCEHPFNVECVRENECGRK